MTNKADVETLEARVHAAEQALLRLEVIEAKGLPLKATKWLQGTTKTALEASADDLLRAIAESRRTRRKDPRRVLKTVDEEGQRPDLPALPLKKGRQSAFNIQPQDPLLAELERRVGRRSLWS